MIITNRIKNIYLKFVDVLNWNNHNIATFENIQERDNLYIYAGDLEYHNHTPLLERFNKTEKEWVGLTLKNYKNNTKRKKCDKDHIFFDITNKMPLPDNSIDIYQSEDTHEHIEYNLLVEQINDIYRCLKPGGLFRLSVPDYNCDLLYNRTIKDKDGKLMFDPFGGGYYDEIEKKVKGNGHVWFPVYQNVKSLLEQTSFSNINFLHYYKNCNKDNNKTTFVLKEIDYQKGYISRTPDNDERVMNPRRPLSIVLDAYK